MKIYTNGIIMNLRSVWHLFCLFFYTYKAVSSSAGEFKNEESIAVDSPTLDHDGDASVITNRRAEQFSNLYKNVHNFSTTTMIKPPFVSSDESNTVASLQWIGSPPNQRLIILYTKANKSQVTNSNLFRSQPNGGMVNETYRWPNAVIDSFFISNDPNKLLFRDLINRRLYLTVDAGENYITAQLQFLPSVIQFSHSIANYLFAIDNTSSLYVSNQFGVTDSWKTISTAVKAAYWTQLKEGQDFDDLSAIYFAEPNVHSGSYRIMKGMSPYSSINKFDKEIGEVINFKLAHEYIFVTKNVTNGSTLFVSYKRQPFVQAKFISTMDGNEHYSVVDASQGQVLLAVFKDNTTADLYISDEYGIKYSLSLRNVITNGNLQWNSGIESLDFYIVKGTRGTYVANVAVIETQQQSYELTVISFNKGGNWSPLTAPTLDSDMLPTECYYPDCSFHLDIHNSGIVSKESAVGMIMARGTLDRGLSQNVGLYLSYDGGFSWQELLKTNATSNTYLFDILDSGSVIIVIMINELSYISDFVISCDTGFTWQTYNTYLQLNNRTNGIYMPELYTEMNVIASLTTIYGNIKYPYSKHVVLNLNISQLNINECKDADYNTWMPSDGRIGDRCVLGEKVTYLKRKLRHCCRNKPNYWLPSDFGMCKCVIEDYGCDVGFERIDYNSPCTPVDGYNPFTPTDCAVGNYYSSSNGYRRIAGGNCVPKDNDYFNNKLVKPCPDRIFDLYVNATPTTAAVDQPIIFDVTVNGRHQFEATYYFLFGDGSHIQNTSNTVNHSYDTPGYFTVQVVVSTAAGNSSTTVGVFVEDMIIGASVLVLGYYPPFTYLFAVTVQYKIGEVGHYGSTRYSWSINKFLHLKNIYFDTTSPLLNHTFESAGRYRYRLIVSNAVSTTHTEGGFTVTSETGVHASISGPAFDSVNSSVEFDVNFVYSIPSDTIYRWIVINNNGGNVLRNVTSSETTLCIEFNSTGVYDIIVQGWNSQSQIVIFNASTTITIRGLYTLDIIPTSEYIEAGQTVNYSLLQLPEVTPNAAYTWSWDDNSSDIVVDGNKNQSHTYMFPGPYTISVSAIEYGETFSAQISIIVLDKISKLLISSCSNLVVGIVVTFTARVELQYGTKYFTQVTYHWNYSDGIDSGPIHIFNEAGTYLVNCTAISYAGSFTNWTFITVEDAVYGLQLMAIPSVVAVNQSVTLFVNKSSNMENYTYSFSFGDMQSSVHNYNGSVVQSYSMSGTYQASVMIQGSSINFYFNTLVTVQDNISTVCVQHYEQSLSVTFIAFIDCGASSDKSYGVIQYTWNFGNGNNVTSYFSSVSTTYQFMGTYNYFVLVSNNVSKSSATGQIHIGTETDNISVQLNISGPRFALVNNSVMFSVISNVSAVHDLAHNWKIIDQETNQVYANTIGNELFFFNFTKPGTYEVLVSVNLNGKIFSSSHVISVESTNTTILLEFSFVTLLQAHVNYENTSWRKQFSDIIDVSLTNQSNLPNWQLIATADDVRNKGCLEIFVDVLPMSSSSEALANATIIAEQLIGIVNENYTFPLPNSSLSISPLSVTMIGLHGLTSGNAACNSTSHTYSHTDDNSLKLGVGIGVPVLVSVVFSILIGVIYCRRKSYNQNKQYGRLRNLNQTSLFLDDADTGLERTDDVPMDEIVLYESSL